ncbi:phospholipase D-like domain-containing protein [Mesorhizobium sp. 10J20-29]
MWRWLLICAAAAAGVVLVLVIQNLIPANKMLQHPVPSQMQSSDPAFARTMSAQSNGAALGANSIDTLVNGDEIFSAMLEAITAARSTINFETYIYWSGEIGLTFAEALAERSRSGVEVRLLVDWAGSIPFDQKLIDLMTGAGVSFHRYRPIRWYTIDRVNNRTHRKLLIVDGKVGFTGGVGIADKWRGNARNTDEWRDTHYRIAGPVVASLQSAFSENWLETTGEVIQGQKFFPDPEPAGDVPAQVVLSSQPEGSRALHQLMLLAISAAESHIRIGMAYFVPDDVMLLQLIEARKRGVEIDIVVPNGNTDVPMVRHSSRYFWGDLLAAGIRIHEFQPTMYHPKLLIVDRAWVCFGSANMDERSLRLNDEANLNVYHEGFADRQIEVFEDDLKRARQISLEEWRSRPISQKLGDWFASLFRSQL